ncbi:UNVERIFIED_CONTAM: DExH-box ATP-dependent RNA helicase DExH1 [Sesamum radiatum]|uniref:DExH-box ATP-dependent RNA helicase DExH1 n=1 Tax=Sesamum radiatum TaxID=300843 RepID=A0AAW2MG41_SESRA
MLCSAKDEESEHYTKEVGKVDIRPASVDDAGVHVFPLPYMIICALLMFGGNLIPSKGGDGNEMLGGYLHFSASKTVLDLIQKLRGELDKLLSRKIEEPGLDITVEGKGGVVAVAELLHSQDVHYW